MKKEVIAKMLKALNISKEDIQSMKTYPANGEHQSKTWIVLKGFIKEQDELLTLNIDLMEDGTVYPKLNIKDTLSGTYSTKKYISSISQYKTYKSKLKQLDKIKSNAGFKLEV